MAPCNVLHLFWETKHGICVSTLDYGANVLPLRGKPVPCRHAHSLWAQLRGHGHDADLWRLGADVDRLFHGLAIHGAYASLHGAICVESPE